MNNKKEISHDKYNNLSDEDKERLRQYAISKLPKILKSSEKAIEFEIFKFIRDKLQ